MKKIDVHAHTTDHLLWDMHVTTATVSDLERAAKQYQIEKICLMATYFPFKGTGLNNEQLLEKIKGKDLFRAFVSLNMMNNPNQEIDNLSKLLDHDQVVGIKIYPGYQDFNLEGEVFKAVCKLAEEKNVPIVFHTGILHYCCKIEERKKSKKRCQSKVCKLDQLQWMSMPKNLLVPIRMFPKVKFIFAHLGNPYYDQIIYVMKEFSNVYTDISGLINTTSDRDIQEFLEILLVVLKVLIQIPGVIDRLMFGTDFPIQSYAQTIRFIDELKLSVSEQEKIYWSNATNILKI